RASPRVNSVSRNCAFTASTRLSPTAWRFSSPTMRAQAVWRKKFGALPQTPAERAKQARFLAARGFSSATIVKLLKVGDDFPIDD
ncbi:RecX family transcriptional regulator, partial [Burkholderia cenocepacia]|nr:RecX family transcriptional regulator [Burkholderia cenocepacia]